MSINVEIKRNKWQTIVLNLFCPVQNKAQVRTDKRTITNSLRRIRNEPPVCLMKPTLNAALIFHCFRTERKIRFNIENQYISRPLNSKTSLILESEIHHIDNLLDNSA